MFERVLVAYDGSASAEDALSLSLALRLRDPAGGHLMLACVLATRPWHLPGRSSSAAEDEAKAMLAEARAGRDRPGGSDRGRLGQGRRP